MTREEAIEWLEEGYPSENWENDGVIKWLKAKEIAIKVLKQEPKTDTWSIKEVADALEKHGIIREQEPILDKIRAEILEEKECAYADFERYKIDYLGVDAEYVEDELPQDDFRYGMERCLSIIDKYRK